MIIYQQFHHRHHCRLRQIQILTLTAVIQLSVSKTVKFARSHHCHLQWIQILILTVVIQLSVSKTVKSGENVSENVKHSTVVKVAWYLVTCFQWRKVKWKEHTIRQRLKQAPHLRMMGYIWKSSWKSHGILRYRQPAINTERYVTSANATAPFSDAIKSQQKNRRHHL